MCDGDRVGNYSVVKVSKSRYSINALRSCCYDDDDDDDNDDDDGGGDDDDVDNDNDGVASR